MHWNAENGQRPNQRVQPTPLAASEIVCILKARIGPSVIPIYPGGAADAQHVGPHFAFHLPTPSEAFVLSVSDEEPFCPPQRLEE